MTDTLKLTMRHNRMLEHLEALTRAYEAHTSNSPERRIYYPTLLLELSRIVSEHEQDIADWHEDLAGKQPYQKS